MGAKCSKKAEPPSAAYEQRYDQELARLQAERKAKKAERKAKKAERRAIKKERKERKRRRKRDSDSSSSNSWLDYNEWCDRLPCGVNSSSARSRSRLSVSTADSQSITPYVKAMGAPISAVGRNAPITNWTPSHAASPSPSSVGVVTRVI